MSNNINSIQNSKPDQNFRVCVRVRPLNTKEDQQTTKRLHNIIKIQDDMVFVYDPVENSSIRDIVAFNQHGAMNLNHNSNNTPMTTSNSSYTSTQILQLNSMQVPQKKPEKEFIFDDVFDESTPTSRVFSQAIEPAAEHILSGYNSTVFAYGMTGAGKSYTVFGNLYSQANADDGIAVLLLQKLYAQAEETSVELTLRFSYFEIYNENIRDLMVQKSDAHLMVIEDPEKGIFVPDLTDYPLNSPQDIKALIVQGNNRRIMASTAANQFSSRSHAIIQIVCEQKNHGEKLVVKSKLCIVDLAGSERAASTENRGVRLTEGANINRSLLALGNCINLLADSNKKGSFVPYRDSKLTRLLKDSLGGNTKSIMIACVSPSSLCYEETVNTLKYASRARNIKKSVKKNAQEMSQHVSEYQDIIQGLRNEILCLKNQLQSKNNENILLKNNQRSVLYNSIVSLECDEQQQLNGIGGSSLAIIPNVTSSNAGVDSICEQLFENLEEYWEIKNTIQEIIKLNEISASFIAERTRAIEAGNHSNGSSFESAARIEIEKRREIISSNQQILTEMNAKLAKNTEYKKDLLTRMRTAGQPSQNQLPSAPSVSFATPGMPTDYDPSMNSLSNPTSSQPEKDIINNNNSNKDAQIAEMQKQMKLMQIELNQKDVLLKQKQSIINKFEKSTNSATSSATPTPKRSACSSISSVHLNQAIIQNTGYRNMTNYSQQSQQQSNESLKLQKFFMKIPKENNNDRIISGSSTSLQSGDSRMTPMQLSTASSTVTSVIQAKNAVKQQMQRSKQQRTDENSNQSLHPILEKKSVGQRDGSRQNRQNGLSSVSIASINIQAPTDIHSIHLRKSNCNTSSNNYHHHSNTPVTLTTTNSATTGSASKRTSSKSTVLLKKKNTFELQSGSGTPASIPESTSNSDDNLTQQYQSTPSSQTVQSETSQPESYFDFASTQQLNKRVKAIVNAAAQTRKQSGKNEKENVNEKETLISGSESIPNQQKKKEQIQVITAISSENIELETEESEAAQKRLKGLRSVSCFKGNGKELELNSYAKTRKKMLEFKEKLSNAVIKPENLNNQELFAIVKEYKSTNLSLAQKSSLAGSGPSDDDIKVMFLEQLLKSSSNRASLRDTDNPSTFSSSSLHHLKKTNSLYCANDFNGNNGSTAAFTRSSLNSSYAQQQQKRKESYNASMHNAAAVATGIGQTTTTSQNFLKNITLNINLPQQQSISTTPSNNNFNKKVFPKAMLAQMNQNTVEKAYTPVVSAAASVKNIQAKKLSNHSNQNSRITPSSNSFHSVSLNTSVQINNADGLDSVGC